MGRKKTIATRNQELKFRVFTLEKQVIEQMAQVAGMSVSAYLRSSAMNRQLRQRLSQDEIEILQMLRGYRHHFRLLSNLIKDKEPGVKQTLEQLISGIDEQLKKLQQ